MDLLKDGGDTVIAKIEKIFSECFKTLTISLAWKNANLIQIF